MLRDTYAWVNFASVKTNIKYSTYTCQGFTKTLQNWWETLRYLK